MIEEEPLLTLFRQEEELAFTLQRRRSELFLESLARRQSLGNRRRLVVLAPRPRSRPYWRPWERRR